MIRIRIHNIGHGVCPTVERQLLNKITVLAGEHNEFTQHYTPISEKNLAARAELLLDQYGRTGTSSPLWFLSSFRGGHCENIAEECSQISSRSNKIGTHHVVTR
jgi:hypothetical protein